MQPIAEKLNDEMRKKEYKYCVCEKKVVPLRRFSCARAYDLLWILSTKKNKQLW